MSSEWRPVPSAPGILASTDGTVMIAPYRKPMPYGGARTYGGTATRGYWDGARFVWRAHGKSYKVARLVCEAFHGPSNGMNCLHDDEDARNNRPENLRWGTQRENLNAPKFLEYCRGRTGANSPFIKGRVARQAA